MEFKFKKENIVLAAVSTVVIIAVIGVYVWRENFSYDAKLSRLETKFEESYDKAFGTHDPDDDFYNTLKFRWLHGEVHEELQ